jgi:hypothetical protein
MKRYAIIAMVWLASCGGGGGAGDSSPGGGDNSGGAGNVTATSGGSAPANVHNVRCDFGDGSSVTFNAAANSVTNFCTDNGGVLANTPDNSNQGNPTSTEQNPTNGAQVNNNPSGGNQSTSTTKAAEAVRLFGTQVTED